MEIHQVQKVSFMVYCSVYRDISYISSFKFLEKLLGIELKSCGEIWFYLPEINNLLHSKRFAITNYLQLCYIADIYEPRFIFQSFQIISIIQRCGMKRLGKLLFGRAREKICSGNIQNDVAMW